MNFFVSLFCRQAALSNNYRIVHAWKNLYLRHLTLFEVISKVFSGKQEKVADKQEEPPVQVS